MSYLCRFAERGYVIAIVQYRPSAVAPHPAQVHDAKTAVRWLRQNSDQYGIDPDRITISGDSSGGHTALLVHATDGSPALDEDPAKPRAPPGPPAPRTIPTAGAGARCCWCTAPKTRSSPANTAASTRWRCARPATRATWCSSKVPDMGSGPLCSAQSSPTSWTSFSVASTGAPHRCAAPFASPSAALWSSAARSAPRREPGGVPRRCPRVVHVDVLIIVIGVLVIATLLWIMVPGVSDAVLAAMQGVRQMFRRR